MTRRFGLLCILGVFYAAYAGGATATAQRLVTPAGQSGDAAQPAPVALPLTLSDAVARALLYNIDILNGQHDVDEARAVHDQATSRLLPHLTTRTAMSSQQVNLAAFGFSGFPGTPSVVGPFPLFDSRLFLSQAILDLDALHHNRAEATHADIARLDAQQTRGVVVLTTVNLYLQAVSDRARIAAASAQFDTATALHDLAVGLKQAGMVAGIDVLRADLQRQTARQRVLEAEHAFEKRKLLLARAIELPLGQPFVLTDTVPYRPLDDTSVERALGEALALRPDYRAAQAEVDAAEAARSAAVAERLPAVDLAADVGTVGRTPTQDAHGTFSVVGSIRVPIFQGGRVSARVAEADALLRRRRDELASFRSRVEYDVRVALLDERVAAEQVELARRSMDLAEQELEQARNRFAAGISGNIEVVEAQASVATATDNHIAGVYAHNFAKAAFSHAVGGAETGIMRVLGEQP